jgi:hypothetical protein
VFLETDPINLRKEGRAAQEPHRGHLDGLLASVRLLKVHTHAIFAEKYTHNRRALRDITRRPTRPACVRIAVISTGDVRTDSRSISRGDTLMSTLMQHWMKLQGTTAGPQSSENIYINDGL